MTTRALVINKIENIYFSPATDNLNEFINWLIDNNLISDENKEKILLLDYDLSQFHKFFYYDCDRYSFLRNKITRLCDLILKEIK